MDSFELNKFAGAALSALLLIFGTKTVLDLSMAGHASHEKAGFTLPAPKEGPAGAATAAAPAFTFALVAAALPKAQAENGQATFKKCMACHTSEKGGPNRVGPNLYGIVGRKAAAVPGFAYSDPMKAHPEWTYQALAEFLHSPKTVVPGTKMVFAGVEDPVEMADLLAYLRTLSDNPQPLPN